jgi:S-adenosylmethionine:diacylglycerol 3-amino-3-carboxypropyl transferase
MLESAPAAREERHQVKVGLMAVVFGRVKGMSVMKAFASNAERLGFSTLWAPEHVVLVDQYQSRYPYRDEGKFPGYTTSSSTESVRRDEVISRRIFQERARRSAPDRRMPRCS